MLNTPFSPWPKYTSEEAQAVAAVLASNRVNYWTGEEGRAFEIEFAAWNKSEYAIALANGTVALDLAWHAINLQRGDEVIVTSRTYLASVSSVILAGAVPIFADVDIDSQNITAASIEPLITPKTKAICCVHLAGWPCEMDQINDLARVNNIFVIEDCAQAHGATYRGAPVGSLGDIAAWSFCQDKIMTTGGEGGMVTAQDEALWKSMWAYKDHGKSWDAVNRADHPPGFRWLHESFGTNFRLTEMQSAIGRIQLKKMEEWTLQRRNNAEMINEAASTLASLRVPVTPDHMCHAHYKNYVFVNSEALKSSWDRDRVMNEVLKRGVPCFTGSCSEVYLEKAFDNTSFRPKKRLPNAVRLGEESLMFLTHPTLKQQEIEKTCSVLIDVVKEATLSTLQAVKSREIGVSASSSSSSVASASF